MGEARLLSPLGALATPDVEPLGTTPLPVRRAAPTMAALWALAGAALAAALLVAEALGRSPSFVLRDTPAVIRDEGCSGAACLGAGAVSNAGGVVWLLGAAACLAAANQLAGSPMRRPLLFCGLLTAMLGADDMLMLHELVLPKLIPGAELMLFAFYAATALWLLGSFRWFFRLTPFVWVALAALLLGGSVAVDVVSEESFLLEDGLKLFGIVTWSGYFCLTAAAAAPGAWARHRARPAVLRSEHVSARAAGS